ncbi:MULTISPECIES: hypothetical protein [Novosphingobium]|uniref:Uncharacterized protein n=1 Tax=Novosphingobium pentaromativorans TaxID=205844 RepID=A0A2W5NQP3_9SPHN|nr:MULTISPECIES: hypothetical protein [Novosphingobium]PZQ55841.1 MAG: hypothetical protein DI555_07445 [Novosphingobium pentaromativorans]GFE72578.1 hypothetical protein NTCA1_02270 [Novosphingobium sp. TCA1]
MKVVDQGIMRFENRAEGFVGRISGLDRGVSSSLVYAGHEGAFGEHGHDARGLMLAVALCACCWLGLGYFLLT